MDKVQSSKRYSDRWEYNSGSDQLLADANGDVDSDGKTNWQAYVLAQAAAATEADIPITQGDHEGWICVVLKR
ncbi:hypothetical protein BCU43_025745 [Vibrio lentus]